MVTADGVTYTADKLANIHLRKSINGKGFSGVSTAEFSCDIYTNFPPAEGSEITFSEVTQSFYIASVNSNGGVCSITAYDLCKNLDIPFDYSGYERLDKNGNEILYPTSAVTAAVANQCGFTGGSVSGRVAQLGCDSVAGKSCRQILEDLSVVNGGFWYDNNGTLAFKAFSPSAGGIDVPGENARTEIMIRGCKNITGVYIYDELGGGELVSGSDWKNTERFSGKFYSFQNASALAGQILGNGGHYDYYGWECDKMITQTFYSLGDFVIYGIKKLPVLSVDFEFIGAQMIASLSAPEADSSFSEYHDLYSRKIAGCVAYDRVLGCTVTTQSGLKFVYTNENQNARSNESAEEYGFKTEAGGITTFDGVMMDGKMPTKIENISDRSKAIYYGDKKYLLSWEVDGEGNKTDFELKEDKI